MVSENSRAVEALEKIADESDEDCAHCTAKQALTEIKGQADDN